MRNRMFCKKIYLGQELRQEKADKKSVCVWGGRERWLFAKKKKKRIVENEMENVINRGRKTQRKREREE